MDMSEEGECSSFSFEIPNEESRHSVQHLRHSTPQNKTPLSSKASLILKKFDLIAPRPENDQYQGANEDEQGWKFWNQVLEIRDVMMEHMDGEDFNFGRKEISKFNKLAREKYDDLVSGS